MRGARHILDNYAPVSPVLAEAALRKRKSPSLTVLNMSPEDGRYAESGREIVPYVNEAALVRWRLVIEAEWFHHLLKKVLPRGILDAKGRALAERVGMLLRDLADNTDLRTVLRVKTVEQKENHDVIAMITACREYVERTLQADSRVDRKVLTRILSYVHLGLTSEDINSASHSLMLYGACRDVLQPAVEKMLGAFDAVASSFDDVRDPLNRKLSLGERYRSYARRLELLLADVDSPSYLSVKFSGATGTHAALQSVAGDGDDAREIAADFIQTTVPEFRYLRVTAQINPHDDLSLWLGAVRRLCDAMQEIGEEIWEDTGRDEKVGKKLLKFMSVQPKAGESGSSAMPQKVQVIGIENMIGSAKLVSGRARGLQRTINVNRQQRELSDSVCIRDMFGDLLPKLLSMFQKTAGDLPKLRVAPRFHGVASDVFDAPVSLQEKPEDIGTVHKQLSTTRKQLQRIARREAGTPMLSRTHNQSASPSTIGKEISVFVKRNAYLESVCNDQRDGRNHLDAEDIAITAKGVVAQLRGDLRLYAKRALLRCKRSRRGSDVPDVVVNRARAQLELDSHYESLGEAVQTTLRRHGVADAYSIVKKFMRGAQMDRDQYQAMIGDILADRRVREKVPMDVQQYLLDLTPQQFIGLAKELVMESLTTSFSPSPL